MAQTIYDAMKSSQNPFSVAALKAIATSDMLFSVLPFVPKGGEAFEYEREKSLGSFAFVADDHTTVEESTGEDELVTVPKREAVADFYIRNFAQENLSGLASPSDRQTIKKFKAAGRMLADKFVNGGHATGFTMDAFQAGPYVDAVLGSSAHLDTQRRAPGTIKYTNAGTKVQFRAPGDRTFGPQVTAATDGSYLLLSDNPSKWVVVTLDVSDATGDAERNIYFTSTTNEFDGLKKLMSSGQVRSAKGANGDAPTLAILDELLDAVKVTEGLAFVMPSAISRKYDNIFRSMGGSNPLTLPNSSKQVASYKGVPFLKNDWITRDETKGDATTLSSIYLVALNDDEGLYMGALGGQKFDVQADPRNASVMGFRLYELGQIQGGPSAFGRRLSWFGAAALGSDLAAARASELISE
jgi:hypothetical protein